MQGGWRKSGAGKLTVGCVGRGKGVRSRWTQETLARREEGWTCSSYGTCIYIQPSRKEQICRASRFSRADAYVIC